LPSLIAGALAPILGKTAAAYAALMAGVGVLTAYRYRRYRPHLEGKGCRETARGRCSASR
jgi:hypothetical protein